MKGANLFGADRSERYGIARVVPTDHHHDVKRLGEQLHDSVLPLLRRAADRVERAEVRGRVVIPVGPGHRCSDFGADRERFLREHRRLVSDPDFFEMALRIEPRRDGVGKPRHQVLGRQLPLNEVADDPGLVHVPDDEIMRVGIFGCLRCRRAGFFMVVLAVHERRKAIARITFHAFPDVENRAAGGVDHHAADLPERLEVLDRDPESRQNDHIGRLNARIIDSLRADLENLHPHVPKLPVHMRIVDDLPGQ